MVFLIIIYNDCCVGFGYNFYLMVKISEKKNCLFGKILNVFLIDEGEYLKWYVIKKLFEYDW